MKKFSYFHEWEDGEMAEKMINPLSENIYKKRIYDRKEDIRGHYFRDQTAIIHSMPLEG